MADPERDLDRPEPLACRVYTHARRHPIVIGNIQGLRIPPVTPAQLGIAVGAVLFLAATRALSAHLGGVANGLILLGVPLALAWAVRSVRMEGRALWRTGLGWLQLLAAPRDGVCLGRRNRQARRVSCQGRAWVAAVDDAEEESNP